MRDFPWGCGAHRAQVSRTECLFTLHMGSSVRADCCPGDCVLGAYSSGVGLVPLCGRAYPWKRVHLELRELSFLSVQGLYRPDFLCAFCPPRRSREWGRGWPEGGLQAWLPGTQAARSPQHLQEGARLGAASVPSEQGGAPTPGRAPRSPSLPQRIGSGLQPEPSDHSGLARADFPTHSEATLYQHENLPAL